RYDDQGRLLYTADSATVTGYDPLSPDLMGFDTDGHSIHLNDNLGLITDNIYYATDDTSSDSAPGYLKETDVRNGELGDRIVQSYTTYTRDPVGQGPYFVHYTYAYPNNTTDKDTPDRIRSSKSYLEYSDTGQIVYEYAGEDSGAVTET